MMPPQGQTGMVCKETRDIGYPRDVRGDSRL